MPAEDKDPPRFLVRAAGCMAYAVLANRGWLYEREPEAFAYLWALYLMSVGGTATTSRIVLTWCRAIDLQSAF
jgi:hypothetical protein